MPLNERMQPLVITKRGVHANSYAWHLHTIGETKVVAVQFGGMQPVGTMQYVVGPTLARLLDVPVGTYWCVLCRPGEVRELDNTEYHYSARYALGDKLGVCSACGTVVHRQLCLSCEQAPFYCRCVHSGADGDPSSEFEKRLQRLLGGE